MAAAKARPGADLLRRAFDDAGVHGEGFGTEVLRFDQLERALLECREIDVGSHQSESSEP